MLHHLDEYGKYVEITGYKNVAFDRAEAFLKANRKQPQKVEVQFFEGDLIATSEHLYFAVLNALAAFRGKTNISKSIAMETMLYASAQRQIQKAIEHCGIKPQTTRMAVIILGDDPNQIQSQLQTLTEYIGVQPNASVLELSSGKEQKIKEAFDISDEEIKTVMKAGDNARAIINLVVEQVALLSTQQ